MPRSHSISTPDGKHLVFLCRAIALTGVIIVLFWFTLFLFLHEWRLALSLVILAVAALPGWLLAVKGYFSAGLMLTQVICLTFVTVFCLLYDVPEGITPRTTHLYLLVIALVGYMNYRTNPSRVQALVIALSLAAFIYFCSHLAIFSFADPLSHRFRAVSAWLNPVLSVGILCATLAAMHADVSRKSLKIRSIQEALYKNEFRLVFQPMVNTAGAIVGAETLLRWQHPVRGTISPAEFIPEAQEAGLMPSIGDWVISQCLLELVRWQKNPLTRHMTMSVNVTVDHLMQDDFVQRLLKMVSAAQVPSTRIKLEITESVFAADPDTMVERMNALSQQGFKFSLDDFGTGFSSLSYLRRLPLQQIKIDRSFVSAAADSRKGEVIVRMIAQMGDELGLEVLAEGVETQQQWQIMQGLGCTVFQGFLFSRPVCADDLHSLIASEHPFIP